MTGKSMMSTALGVGLATAALGMYVYSNSKPTYKKKIQQGMSHAVDEVSDAMGHVSDTVRKTVM